MSGPRVSRGAFRGVTALLAERRALFVHVSLWAGFALAFLFGLLCALARAATPSALRELGLPAFAAACGCMPLLVACPWTCVSQANAPLRRDELLVLPLGRLALPTATLVGSLLGLAAWLVATLLGLALTIGPRPLLEALLDPAAADTVHLWLVASVAAFAVGTSVGAIGSSWGLAACGWGLAPLVVLSAFDVMGYDGGTRRAYAMLWTAGLTVYFLVLPFLLYSRPLHIWTSSRQPGVEGPWLIPFATVVGATIALGLAGAGWLLAGVLAVGGALTWVARRSRPPLRGPSAIKLALLASLVPVVPLTVLGLVVDARADVERADGLVQRKALLAPDGRHVAFDVEPRLAVEGGLCPRTRRVVVVDVAGERAPIFVPARFAELEVGAWSSDGRFLAVEDHSVGRLRRGPTRPARKAEADVDPFDIVGFKVGTALSEAWIVDTHTGEVEVRGAFEVAPGWTTPDDLVTCSSSLAGDHVLRDGAGRELVVPRSRGALRVVGYAGGRPVFVLGPHAPGVIDPTFGPVAAGLHRWDVASGLVEHDPARGARWSLVMAPAGEADPGRAQVCRDGAALELDADVRRVLLEACDGDAIVALAGNALVRIDARDGARTVLVPGDGDAPLHVRAIDRASGAVLVVRGGAPLLVDPRTGRCTPLPPVAVGATALVGEAMLVEAPARGWPALLAADGTSRPVKP